MTGPPVMNGPCSSVGNNSCNLLSADSYHGMPNIGEISYLFFFLPVTCEAQILNYRKPERCRTRLHATGDYRYMVVRINYGFTSLFRSNHCNRRQVERRKSRGKVIFMMRYKLKYLTLMILE